MEIRPSVIPTARQYRRRVRSQGSQLDRLRCLSSMEDVPRCRGYCSKLASFYLERTDHQSPMRCKRWTLCRTTIVSSGLAAGCMTLCCCRRYTVIAVFCWLISAVLFVDVSTIDLKPSHSPNPNHKLLQLYMYMTCILCNTSWHCMSQRKSTMKIP